MSVRTSVTVIVTLLFASAMTGCGSDNKSAAPPATARPETVAPATLPLSVGRNCAETTRQVLLEIHDLGRNATLQYDEKSPFYKALLVSLNACSSRIEWSDALRAEDPGGGEAARDTAFRTGCAAEKALAGHPIPAACNNP